MQEAEVTNAAGQDGVAPPVSLEATMVAVLFAALPGAPPSYILARQLGGDGELMASVLTVQTAIAVLTLPLVLGLLR